MAKKSLHLPSVSSCVIIIISVISLLIMPITGFILRRPWGESLFVDEISSKLSVHKPCLAVASTDFGNLVHSIPGAMFHPSSEEDIVSLVNFAYNHSSFPALKIAARGRGHSCRGQAMVDRHGIVIDMPSLSLSSTKHNNYDDNSNYRIRVCSDPELGFYAEVGGEQLWIDVLHATLEHGVAPVSWTDYLYLSVGGTLSNAGISGQAFRYGPQISTVLQLEVVTGKGELISCGKERNPELFYAVLGGLGQFGIITRAKIKLEAAPKRVKWVRMLYEDFATFTRDQEQLISEYGNYQETGINKEDGVDYVQGSVIMQQGDPNNWRSSFFTAKDQAKITSLNVPGGMLYCLEVAKYYYPHLPHHSTTFDEKLERQLEKLNFIPGYIFTKEVTLVEFLNRVRKGELQLQSKGLWEVPHPWLNIFIPRSQIQDFYPVIADIIAKDTNDFAGPVLIYPLNRNKWDDRMSAITPEEDVFYTLGLLHSSGFNDWKPLELKNEAILKYCDKNGIKIKQYLPHYTAKEDWKAHFGSKWGIFQQRKTLFDPKLMLSPGQNIFSNLSYEE